MKHLLTENDKDQIEKRISETEKILNIQIVFATTQQSDSYVEIPWKAFAFGASLAALTLFITDFFLSTPAFLESAIAAEISILGVGALFAAASVLIHYVARLFLSDERAEKETRQYAESLFLSRELFATDRRCGVLLLVSRFERKVVILPDKGLHNILTELEMKRIIGIMKPLLARNQFRKAMETALNELACIITPAQNEEQGLNELSDSIIEGEV
jgi:putative membrane protein